MYRGGYYVISVLEACWLISWPCIVLNVQIEMLMRPGWQSWRAGKEHTSFGMEPWITILSDFLESCRLIPSSMRSTRIYTPLQVESSLAHARAAKLPPELTVFSLKLNIHSSYGLTSPQQFALAREYLNPEWSWCFLVVSCPQTLPGIRLPYPANQSGKQSRGF